MKMRKEKLFHLFGKTARSGRFRHFLLGSGFHDLLDAELILEEQRILLAEDGEYQLVVEFQTVEKVDFAHDRVLDLAAEEYAFEKVVEFDTVNVPDNENIDDLVRGLREKVPDFSGNRNQSHGFLAAEEVFDRPHRIICLHEHVEQLVENDAVLVNDVELFLVVFLGLADAEFFEIDELPAHRIDLFSEVATEFADEKSGFPVSRSMLDEEFLQQLGAAVRSEKFGKAGHIGRHLNRI